MNGSEDIAELVRREVVNTVRELVRHGYVEIESFSMSTVKQAEVGRE